jgi:hypothetical protein
MRLAANKSRGKGGDDKQKEKIVRRFVFNLGQVTSV